jgi:hypothetical protein
VWKHVVFRVLETPVTVDVAFKVVVAMPPFQKVTVAVAVPPFTAVTNASAPNAVLVGPALYATSHASPTANPAAINVTCVVVADVLAVTGPSVEDPTVG